MVNAPAQLATATALGLSPSVAQGVGVNAQIASALGSALIPAANATALTFPASRLGVRVDLLLGGVWTDITQYVYQRNPLQISNAGRSDWTGTIQPAQLTLTVNNRDGRFTPKLSTGAYFPNIVRNCQIRVFVTTTSSAGVSYAGFRFYGEISEWPPAWDPSARDVTVDIVASGIWRRISQFQTTLGSAFRRFVDNLASPAVQAYWPCEDGTGSGQVVPFGSPAGTQNGIQQFVSGQAGLSFASSSDFSGSDAVFTLNGATVTFTVPAGGTPTNNVTRFVMSVPQAGDSGQNNTNWNLVEIDSAGTVAKFEVYVLATGRLQMNLLNSGGAIIAQGSTTTDVRGIPYLVSCELTPGVSFALRIIKQGATGITESITGSLGSGSISSVTKVVVNRSFQLQDTGFGHLYISYGSPPTMVGAAYALGGYVGEFALTRFQRICTEMGITSATIGSSSSSAPLGPQVDDTLPNVLQSIEDTDCGLLYELRDQFGLGYRTNASMANQQAQVVLNYTNANLDASLTASYDDQLTRNNITISNWTGYTQQAILTAGAMSVLNPPSGIGNGYAYQRNVIAAKDNQCPGIATFLLNVGAVDEIRFPVVTIKMIRQSNAGLFSSIPNLDIGDYFQITNAPSFLTTTTVKQLMWGYSETLNAKEWTFAFNTVPETPWETGFSPGTIQTAQIPGGSPVSSQAAGTSGLASLIANGSITPGMLSGGITLHTLGGNAVTISASAPPSPNVNDIWIATATGLISQWNGTSWVPYKFDASATIQAATITAALIVANTITATQIAANTITAAQLAAGIVYAGIVDATTIQAAQYIASGSTGEFLAYSGTPGSGNIVASISGMSGSDTFSNPYAQGVEIQTGGLVLDNQGSAPPAVSGASTFYSSTVGRPRYKSQSGDDSILERSTIDVTDYGIGNTATATVVSGHISYLANEGAQSNAYEIEIWGYMVQGSTAEAFGLHLYIDAASTGADISFAGAALVAGHGYDYHAKFIVAISTGGASGHVSITGNAVLGAHNTNLGNTENFAGAAHITGVAYDCTTTHTIAIYGQFAGAGGAGQTADTYITKLSRYD